MQESKKVNGKEIIADKWWRAIVSNDSSYDGTFYYAVKTTGIFCRPSCKSRLPKKENVLFFRTSKQALSEGFRSCKRCKPDGILMPDKEWIGQISHWIGCHYTTRITLAGLAEQFHGSPYHLQRTYKRVLGMTPAKHILELRLAKAEQLLVRTDLTITEIASAAGMRNAAHFATVFQNNKGLTPTAFRQLHNSQRSGHRESIR